ncbi:hypothetical protein NADFUDRAFT_84119 [Nadsonia fulvescens var. elongata DSM 6958]|uniref:Amino acid transporter transmembrane domain-containing protein n=1 Tax=Nadsonia fulvescens var. elongata DSM 6958 TaxID=857566 RepID=A0A1E3PGY1_9ASCO|nr:hypothetical protein NADFUDRAFT_84119 [Nadsonia fulvescens var. elongata DSM 6958]
MSTHSRMANSSKNASVASISVPHGSPGQSTGGIVSPMIKPDADSSHCHDDNSDKSRSLSDGNFNESAKPSRIQSFLNLGADYPGAMSITGSGNGGSARRQSSNSLARQTMVLSDAIISSTASAIIDPTDGDDFPASSSYQVPPSPSVKSIDIENPHPEVVKVVGRHLVNDSDFPASYGSNNPEFNSTFDSLKLQGGDITRQLYNWQRTHEDGDNFGRRGRSQSFDVLRDDIPDDTENLNIQSIKAPGGFRRNFLVNKAQAYEGGMLSRDSQPTFLTRNFIEFLSIYGHFAGEELEEEDEEEEEESNEGARRQRASRSYDGHLHLDQLEPDEETPLNPHTPTRKSRRQAIAQGNASASKAVMLLLKSFVGTGILFLPKAFLNGGLLFSSLVLTLCAALCYWCFLLLVQSRMATGINSFGDIGGALYGPVMRQMIISSIVVSQIGFASAYIVFTSENLRAFVLSIWGKSLNIETLILIQLIIFMPLSMVRDIVRLSGTALIADLFIMLGLIYLYYWSGSLVAHNGISDIVLFNSDNWALFLGTAIFTFEGVGLIIPIQESMKHPHQFTSVLAGVMIGITFLFVSMGALCYSAFGSQTQTVVILNLPQESKFVNGVQLLYSAAILLSTPLQLFPAIRIMENGIFTRSGKFNSKVKWQKNIFRTFIVMMTACVAWGGADDLDKFVALVGSFACIPLVFLYPPLLHLKSCAKTSLARAGDIFLCVIGILAMVYTTYQTLSQWLFK